MNKLRNTIATIAAAGTIFVGAQTADATPVSHLHVGTTVSTDCPANMHTDGNGNCVPNAK